MTWEQERMLMHRKGEEFSEASREEVVEEFNSDILLHNYNGRVQFTLLYHGTEIRSR